jgi:DNA polymerase IV
MTCVRTIFHVDMDAFFVSVEELFDPSLKGKPVVVGGRPDERGVCAAASYEARKFGVHSAMPLRTAHKLCPHAIFIDGHPERYRDYSHKVLAVLNRFSPQVEMASIDEAYLDMTGTEKLHGPPLRAAHALHTEMKRSTQLNCSIGIGSSRLIAKISSDQAKPNGVLFVLPGEEHSFLRPLDVRKIPGVGKVTEKRLNDLGIKTVGDLAKLDEDFLRDKFGEWGVALSGKARGEDAGGWFSGEIGDDLEAKSISHEHTYSEDTRDQEQIEATLARLCEMVGRRLREAGFHAANISLKLRFEDFSTITRAHTLATPTNLDPEIYREVLELFRRNWLRDAQGRPREVRLIGVKAAAFSHHDEQMDLLNAERDQRWDKALAAADKLRDKFGEGAVSLARGLRGTFRERTHEAMLRAEEKEKGKL